MLFVDDDFFLDPVTSEVYLPQKRSEESESTANHILSNVLRRFYSDGRSAIVDA